VDRLNQRKRISSAPHVRNKPTKNAYVKSATYKNIETSFDSKSSWLSRTDHIVWWSDHPERSCGIKIWRQRKKKSGNPLEKLWMRLTHVYLIQTEEHWLSLTYLVSLTITLWTFGWAESYLYDFSNSPSILFRKFQLSSQREAGKQLVFKSSLLNKSDIR